MAAIERQCEFGPRIPGSEGHAACRQWISQQIAEIGLTLWEQPFAARLAMNGAEAKASNLWGLPRGVADDSTDAATGPPLIILSAHWDTRPWADQEPAGRPTRPFLGANDGGSGVALALELARSLKDTPLFDQIVLVFFDAEDSGIQNVDESWCLGSQFAAANLPEWIGRVRLGINLDMVAGRGMKLYRESYSQEAQPGAMNRLWRIGRDLSPDIFVDATRGAIIDDHLAFIRAGVPFIDLIGLPYPYWHRLGDRPERCDPEVMRRLGMVLKEFIRAELRRKK